MWREICSLTAEVKQLPAHFMFLCLKTLHLNKIVSNCINKDGVFVMYCRQLCGNLAHMIFLLFISLCTVLVSVDVVHIGVMMSECKKLIRTELK
jgi:hypothetical protein